MMNRLFLLLSLLYTTLFGYEYDKLLLKAQSNIFPKLILLDKDISKKVSNNEVIFCIVHHTSDLIKSIKIKKLIENKYGKYLEKYKLKIVIKEFDEIKKDDKVNAYYILQGSRTKIKKVCKIAQKNNIPTFAYDPLYFYTDALISMEIQNNSTIYLNKKALKKYNINFADIFYQIVRFFDE